MPARKPKSKNQQKINFDQNFSENNFWESDF